MQKQILRTNNREKSIETNTENLHFYLGIGRATMITVLKTWPCCWSPRGDSHIKRAGGCSSEIFKKTPKRYRDSALWAWLGIFFVPWEVPFLKQHIISYHYFTFFTFFNPQNYDEHPGPFYMGVPWGLKSFSIFCFSWQAGASGALFGLIGLLIIKLLQLRHEVKRPCVEALILLGVVLVSFGKLGN